MRSSRSCNYTTYLTRVVILGVQQETQFRQKLGPVLELSFGGDRGDKDA